MTLTYSLHYNYLPDDLQDIIYDKLEKLRDKYKTVEVEAYISENFYECDFTAQYSIKFLKAHSEYEEYQNHDFEDDIMKYYVIYTVIIN